MTPRRRTAVVAALAVGGCLGAPAAAAPAASADGALPRVAAPARATGGAHPVRVLRSEPADGAWVSAPPVRVRLWFDGADGRTPTARVSTPRRPGMADASAAWSGGVLTVKVPDDGPGEYRVVWFLVPADGGPGAAAAGTVAYRVGTGAPTGRSSAFTIPASPTGAAADVLAGTSSPRTGPAGTATGSATAAPPARATSATVSEAAPTGRAAVSAPTAPAAPPAPSDAFGAAPDRAAVPLWRRGFRPGTPAPAGLAGLALGGLLALAGGAAWSVRAGSRAATRPR